MKVQIISAAVILLAGAGFYTSQKMMTPEQPTQSTAQTTALAQVTLPQALSDTAQIGKTAYESKCMTCHAQNGEGQNGVAPPLIHKIYEPSHHGDESFQRAAAIGVRSHHWRFGDMPPVDGVTRGDVKMIVAYIRELQRANGIN